MKCDQFGENFGLLSYSDLLCTGERSLLSGCIFCGQGSLFPPEPCVAWYCFSGKKQMAEALPGLHPAEEMVWGKWGWRGGYCLGLEASSRVSSLNHCRMWDVGIWMRMHYWEKLEGVPAHGSCLEKGAEYMVIGGRTGGLFYCGMSHLAIVLSHFQPSQIQDQALWTQLCLVIISWKMGDLRGELPHRFVFSLNVGTGTFLLSCAVIGALLLPQEVSCLLLATPSHVDAQGFVQPCGELGQEHDLIKNCAE